MALFPVNQNGQWFTVNAYQASTLTNVGDITINSDNQTTKSAAKKIWFEYKDAAGNKRSEVIERKNGGRITVVPASVMAHTKQGVTIAFDTNVSSTPVVGETYGIYINQRNYHALGDNMFMELGAEVRYGSKFNFDAETNTSVTAGEAVIDSVAKLMTALKQAFVRNLGADSELYDVTINSSNVILIVDATPTSYIRGTMQADYANLTTQDVHLSNITVNTIERNDWATVAAATGGNVPNSMEIADMEWFYLGEHGDNQRLAGYPNVNAAQLRDGYYKVNAAHPYGYDLVIIHHAYVGSGNAVQKSEQDIMIAIPTDNTENAQGTHTTGNAFLNALNDYFTNLSATVGTATETVEF